MSNNLSQQDIKNFNNERKIKRALKKARLRGLKNFFIWLFGVISAFILVAAGIVICVKVVPVKNFLGSSTGDYIREDIAKNSAFDIALKIKEYKVSDFPVIDKAVDYIVNESGISAYVYVDTASLKDIHFDNTNALKDKVLGAITLNPDCLGEDLKNISVLTTAEKVNLTLSQVIIKEDFASKYKTYYYAVEDGGKIIYKRAFDDNRNPVSGVNESTVLYFPALSDVALSELSGMLSNVFGRVKVSELIDNLAGGMDQTVEKLIGDKTVDELSSFDINEVELSVLLELPTEQNGQKNKELYEILCSAVNGGKAEGEQKATNETLKVSDLTSNLDFDNLELSQVVDDEELLKILCSTVVVNEGEEKPTVDTLKVKHLNNVKFENLRIGDVITLNSEDTLYKILSDIYGEENVDDVTVSQVKAIDINLVKFGSVINQEDADGNDNKIYLILKDAFNCESVSDVRNITIGAISQGIDIGTVKLKTVLGDVSSDNNIINALLKDEDVTVSEIGTSIDKLTLSTIFGDNCFTENADGKYYKTERGGKTVYTTQPETGATRYDVSEDAKIWLFLMYDGGVDFDEQGFRKEYTENSLTYGEMKEKVGTLSTTILNCTVRELVITGMLTGEFKAELYNLSFIQVLDRLNKIPA